MEIVTKAFLTLIYHDADTGFQLRIATAELGSQEGGQNGSLIWKEVHCLFCLLLAVCSEIVSPT